MIEYNDATTNLIPFFRKLADDIENNNLTTNQLILAGQMFMKYEFENRTDPGLSDEKVKTYLFTGWYIHEHIQSTLGNPQN